ncbi:hypothetical protein ACFC0S_16470 [Streptomyces sp. NPDC056084]|uniref:hypothetical protein n=1 Tax=unclassified Streptomyces TaxID=2593676 RepID=UPI0035DB4570
MRLTVRASGREIDIELAQNSTAALKAAETTALALLKALPTPEPENEEVPFGFTVSSDTERAEPEQDDDE